jgi:hypothetical protein
MHYNYKKHEHFSASVSCAQRCCTAATHYVSCTIGRAMHFVTDVATPVSALVLATVYQVLMDLAVKSLIGADYHKITDTVYGLLC